jgi:hypothetical protein
MHSYIYLLSFGDSNTGQRLVVPTRWATGVYAQIGPLGQSSRHRVDGRSGEKKRKDINSEDTREKQKDFFGHNDITVIDDN